MENEFEISADKRRRFLAEHGVRKWLTAVIVQGVRCMEAVQRQSKLFVSEDMEILHTVSRQRQAEEHFFIVAADHAREWLKVFAKCTDTTSPAIDQFLSLTAYASELRNMVEHEIAYLFGEGHKQERYTHRQPWGIADGSSTVILGEDYLLGGRLDVLKTMSATEQLREHLFPRVAEPTEEA